MYIRDKHKCTLNTCITKETSKQAVKKAKQQLFFVYCAGSSNQNFVTFNWKTERNAVNKKQQ